MYKRTVIAIDPAVSNNIHSDETGIIVAAIDEENIGYILDDLSGKYAPLDWAKTAVQAYHTYKADRIIAEVNQGGNMVEQMLRIVDSSIPLKTIHASKGKHTRAEPIAALYEQGKVFHTKCFRELEDQMCNFSFNNTKSPDRVDALVWALTELMLSQKSHKNMNLWAYAGYKSGNLEQITV